MAANITPVFKSTIKALIQTSDSQCQNSSPPSIDEENLKFKSVCQSVLKTIIKLRLFVADNKEEFINVSDHIKSNSKLNIIDQEIENSIHLINAGLAQVRKIHLGSQFSEQIRQHRQAVLEILQKYMKNVVNTYKEQVEVRRKRISLQKKIAGHRKTDGLRKRNPQTSEESKSTTKSQYVNHSILNGNASNVAEHPDDGDNDSKLLSKEDMQMFAEENEMLFDELNSMVNEVKNLESKITEIAQLQDLFTEQVLKQEKDIDHIAQTAVTTTENVKGGNEQLREAMRNQSTLRFWVLFFVIVCTLTLIFLDWYNP